MTNENVANIAVTVTAAMLATVAVAFTLSGNAPSDPRSSDLPLISVGTVAARASTSTTPASPPKSSPSVAEPSIDAPLASNAPTTVRKPAGSSTSVATGASAASAGAGAVSEIKKTHEAGNKGDDEHEVVVPKVHDSDEDEGKKPEDDED